MMTRTRTILAAAVALSWAATAAAQNGTVASAAAPAPPTAPARPASVVGDEYRLNAGDKLRIEVYKDAQLSQSLQIRPDGKITLPLVGDVPAAGLTALQLRDELTASLKEYVTNPVVTVIVAEAVHPQVYVMGEVNAPGAQTMRGPMTAMQALAMAGGLNEWAKSKEIRILRPGPKGVQTLKYNFKDASKGLTEDLRLEPGDTVIVP
jgi:polysaccharide biosynthesis/export protein